MRPIGPRQDQCHPGPRGGPPSREDPLPGPLVAQEADEGRAPDEVGGGDSAEQAVEDGEALGGPRPPRRAPVTIAAYY